MSAEPARSTRRFALLILIAILAQACEGSGSVLSQEVAARRLAAELRVQFSKAAEASNRAVMADTDQASVAAAREAEETTRAAEEAAKSLGPVLQQLGRADEIGLMEGFNKKFAEYRSLDRDILGLAVENTNLKAQRLSFGPAREAADAFRGSLDTIARANPSKEVDALAARAALAVREIQVLEARHIAEPDDAAMTRMEGEMAAAASDARKELGELSGKVAAASRQTIAEARAALDRFMAAHAELLMLSRRNSNVRSLALSLGQKRVVTAECDDMLQSLQDAIARHEFRATR
jgi:hypothetical protein